MSPVNIKGVLFAALFVAWIVIYITRLMCYFPGF